MRMCGLLCIRLVVAFIIFPAIAESSTCIPENRFIENHNATVTDIDSGLIWMRCSLGQTWDQPRCNGIAVNLTWNAAYDVAKKLNKKAYGHVTDWRVPTLRELATLIERQCPQPRINSALFPDTPAARFWSATRLDM